MVPSRTNFGTPSIADFGELSASFRLTPSALDHRDLALGRALIGIGVFRRAGADQPEMIEERAAERAHEEIVGERVAPRDLPERQLGGIVIVISHDQGARIRIGGELVVLAAVDLHLVLIEQMPRALGDDIERPVLKPLRASIANGRLGRCSVCASVTGGVTPMMVRPPQTGGNSFNTEPSRSR